MKILIPLDGSKFAEDVLEPVMRLAGRNDKIVALHLVRVVKDSEAHNTWNKFPPPGTEVPGIWSDSGIPAYHTPMAPLKHRPRSAVETKDQALDRLFYEAKEYLDQVADRLFPYVTKKTVVFGDDPAEELTNYAREEEVDLIAIATHGRTGLARLLFGSVAGKLAKAGATPLFTVHPGGKYQGALDVEIPAPVEPKVPSEPIVRAA